MRMDWLSLGVPTFNRRESVIRLIESVHGEAQVLVVDDGSSDGTADALAGIANVKCMRHATNLGYAQALLHLFRECRSEYLLVVADDDVVDSQALHRLSRWLQETEPDFVSSQFILRNGYLARGQGSSRRIRPEEWRKAANDASGLVYKVASVRRSLERVAAFICASEEAAVIYPQVLILAELIINRADCWWWNDAVVTEGDGLPTGLISTTGASYASFEARLAQHDSFSRFLQSREGAEELYRLNADNLLKKVRGQLSDEARSDLDLASARRLVGKRRTRALIARAAAAHLYASLFGYARGLQRRE